MGICRELRPGLCNTLDGWGGVGGERQVEYGGDLGIPKADSWRYTQTPTQHCKAIILQ